MAEIEEWSCHDLCYSAAPIRPNLEAEEWKSSGYVRVDPNTWQNGTKRVCSDSFAWWRLLYILDHADAVYARKAQILPNLHSGLMQHQGHAHIHGYTYIIHGQLAPKVAEWTSNIIHCRPPANQLWFVGTCAYVSRGNSQLGTERAIG